MRFFRKWLSIDRPPGIALNPARTVEITGSAADVLERCITGIEGVLGGHTDAIDRSRGEIEASFGLVNSERLTISIEPAGANTTRVRIASRRGAISQQPRESSYVDALATFLTAR